MKKNFFLSVKIIVYTDWCQERNIITPLLKTNTTELDQNLARFYVEARTKKGEEYNRSAFLGFRNSIERHLNNNGVTVKLSKNLVFQNSNKILDAALAKKIFNLSQLLYHQTLPKFELARSSV